MELTRADRHRNPTCFPVDLAKRAGLQLGTEYTIGEAFDDTDGRTHYTARLFGDPIAVTLKVIDRVGFYAIHLPRWRYISIPGDIWATFSHYQRILTVKSMYWQEGGTEMNDLFTDALLGLGAYAEEQTRG